MVRRVFFSFHYETDDIWRANQVRLSWVTQDREAAGFCDQSLWEETQTRGDGAVRRMIDAGLKGTSVTVVLIGAHTWERKWVKYEIEKSYSDGKGLVGVHIHNLGNKQGRIGRKGPDPLEQIKVPAPGLNRPLSALYDTYDYLSDDGYANLGRWIERAVEKADR